MTEHIRALLLITCCHLLIFDCPMAQTATRYQVVIDELLPDPSPPVELPNYEFVELKNVSATAFNLKNWKLSDGSSTATITASFILQPDSFVIICATTAAPAFAVFGSTIGVSNFPSLNNDADVIALYAPNGTLIHSVAYNSNWYRNDVKSQGGWTLEMIDAQNPCSGSSNWKASTDNKGGTPGKKNSVNDVNKDDIPPALDRTYTIDSTTIVAIFDEPVDSASAALAPYYTLNNGIGHPISASPLLPSCTNVVLKLPAALQPNTVYGLTIDNVTDCAGNVIGQFNTAQSGLPQVCDSLAVVINEILFNPKPDGYDYIELYNRSKEVIDLKQLYLASRNATGQLTNLVPLSTDPVLFFPGEYKVFTENKLWLQQQYLVKDPSLIIELPALPSMPDDAGIIVLTNMQGAVVDELHYDAKWHFALISDDEGVALERISYNQPTQDKFNWTSAAATTGFGTPGYQNSQLLAGAGLQGGLTVSPEIFSPDNDGRDDFATIQYQLSEPGYVANISIFNANGHRVRYLVQNATLALNGTFRWDGLDDHQNRLPMGMYIILTEIFNLQGKTKKFKHTVGLARRF